LSKLIFTVLQSSKSFLKLIKKEKKVKKNAKNGHL